MSAEGQLVRIEWIANPFRGDRFGELWAPAAELVMEFGATSWALLRSKEDGNRFTQFATFPDKLSFERYWLSEQLSEIRTDAIGLFQLPILPAWLEIVGAGRAATANA